LGCGDYTAFKINKIGIYKATVEYCWCPESYLKRSNYWMAWVHAA